jgi:hypothetical protein
VAKNIADTAKERSPSFWLDIEGWMILIVFKGQGVLLFAIFLERVAAIE